MTQLNIKIVLFTIEGKISTLVAGVVRFDLQELDCWDFFVDARLRLQKKKEKLQTEKAEKAEKAKLICSQNSITLSHASMFSLTFKLKNVCKNSLLLQKIKGIITKVVVCNQEDSGNLRQRRHSFIGSASFHLQLLKSKFPSVLCIVWVSKDFSSPITHVFLTEPGEDSSLLSPVLRVFEADNCFLTWNKSQ